MAVEVSWSSEDHLQFPLHSIQLPAEVVVVVAVVVVAAFVAAASVVLSSSVSFPPILSESCKSFLPTDDNILLSSSLYHTCLSLLSQHKHTSYSFSCLCKHWNQLSGKWPERSFGLNDSLGLE